MTAEQHAHDNTSHLDQHRRRMEVWREKYAIRACYRSWYERLRPFIADGPSVEIGGGFGGLKTYWQDLWTTDLIPVPGLDMVADAHRLPFDDGSIGNLLVIDLLHHLQDPHALFDEAARVLRPGGRMLIIEPYITPVSYLAYRLLHHERIWFGGYHETTTKTDPWQGNLAVANLLFSREAKTWPQRHPTLRVIRKRKFSFFDFQLAGGFKPYAFVKSPRLYDFFLTLDRRMDFLAPLVGFRIFCVIENVR